MHPNDPSSPRSHCILKLQLYRTFFFFFFPSWPRLRPFAVLSTVLPSTTYIHILGKKGNRPSLLFPLNEANCCFWNKPHYSFFPFLFSLPAALKLNQTPAPQIELSPLWNFHATLSLFCIIYLSLENQTLMWIPPLLADLRVLYHRVHRLSKHSAEHNIPDHWIGGKCGEMGRFNKSREILW